MRRTYDSKKIGEECRALINVEIKEFMSGDGIVKIIKERQLRWFLHLNRREEKTLVKRIIKGKQAATGTEGDQN